MITTLRRTVVLVTAIACTTISTIASAQTFALDPASPTLLAVPATSGDLLTTSVVPAPGPLPPPAVGLSATALGLLPGDVIDAISFGNDAAAGEIHFTVNRTALPPPGGFPAEVASEATLVPPGFQPEASSDIFISGDPAAGVPFGANTQILDGDGIPIGPLTSYLGLGLGLTEVLVAPGPPLVDQISDFDWSAPGMANFSCVFLSLAPGSPSLTPASNPLLLAGAEPGDILISCPGGFTPFLGVSLPASVGLTSGGPGCIPPACDDIDGLLAFPFAVSLAAGSPSLVSLPATPGDLIDPLGGGILMPHFLLGLTPADDVKGLERTANPCPAFPGSLMDLDGDGVDVACPDNCLLSFNPTQDDSDGDTFGDACDACTDTDADGFGNPGFPANTCATDLCPFTAGPNADADGDGVGDICDNCPAIANSTQADGDFDSIGDVCDTCTDIDGDGFGVTGDVCGVDNCPFVPNVAQTDTDVDTVGDACDNCVLVANLAQADADADSVGNLCDNCQADPNLGQADADLDGAGDVCDICTLGVAVTKAQLKFTKIGTPGSEGMQIKGTAAFLAAVPIPPVDVSVLGMVVQVIDLGNGGNLVMDHTIPAGLVPTVCGVKDGWKVNGSGTSEKYANATNSIQPACLAGSGDFITKAGVNDKTAALKGVGHKVQAKNASLGTVVGPFRVVVAYGGVAEEAAGQCSETTYTGAQCVLNGSGTTLTCKQP